MVNWLKSTALSKNLQRAGIYIELMQYFLEPYFYEQTAKASLTLDCFRAFVKRKKKVGR